MKVVMPIDGWGHFVPRRCQLECLPILIDHFSKPNPDRAIVRKIMGSGKSVTMAQFAACCEVGDHETIVVSTSSINLVEQLSATFRERLESDFMCDQRVGTYYTHSKEIHTPIIITCLPSLQTLSDLLQKNGKRCALWIADEFHKCEVKSIKTAYETLMPGRVCAFTATPFRTNEKQSLTLVDRKIYDYGPAEALRDKVVVPWRIVPWEGGEADRDSACIQMTHDAVGPGMYDADSISDAEVFAQKLKDIGHNVEAVHSKLPPDEHRKRMQGIKSGSLRALVHVSQLVEGSDIPNLRWICLRRSISSRVRFVQQVGRALRAHPGKEEAVIYDPHGLFDVFRLTYEEVIGGVGLDESEEEDEGKQMEKQLHQEVFEMMRHIVQANAGKAPLSVTPLAGYLRELVNAFDVCGLIDRKIASRDWRSSAVSKPQATSIEKMVWATGRKCVPSIHKKALEILCGKSDEQNKQKYAAVMNRGIASDLLSILHSLADKKSWPDFRNLDNSASTAIDKAKGAKKSAITPDTTTQREAKETVKAHKMMQGELF